jgi:hypothetical protein
MPGKFVLEEPERGLHRIGRQGAGAVVVLEGLVERDGALLLGVGFGHGPDPTTRRPIRQGPGRSTSATTGL